MTDYKIEKQNKMKLTLMLVQLTSQFKKQSQHLLILLTSFFKTDLQEFIVNKLNITLSIYTSLMQFLAQASELSKKGETYESQGNYDYAAQTYKKVVVILEGVIKMHSNDHQRVKQLKDKAIKYRNLVELMLRKEKEKNAKNSIQNVHLSKFGFPTQQTLSQQQKNLIRNTIKPIKNNLVKLPLKTTHSQEAKIPIVKNDQNALKMNRNSLNPNVEYNNFSKNEILKEIDPEIRNLIVKSKTTFDDIVGMKETKKILEEAVIRPRKRPDLYSGIRAPPKGLLLYGPPGNGKTFICKALANESGCTFMALSAASIMNKFVGETQKTLRKIFDAASKLSPTIIFIDEIDSILTNRSQNENQASRRLKTEFLVLLDGINSPKGGEILVIGATNLPQELDLAAKRRFNKLIYIGMPDKQSRKQLLLKNLEEVEYSLSTKEIQNIVTKLQGYAASEITNIIKEVCMMPLREITTSELETVNKNKIRRVGYKDFCDVMSQIPPLLTKKDLEKYNVKM